jgi:hypothetical protein
MHCSLHSTKVFDTIYEGGMISFSPAKETQMPSRAERIT